MHPLKELHSLRMLSSAFETAWLSVLPTKDLVEDIEVNVSLLATRGPGSLL